MMRAFAPPVLTDRRLLPERPWRLTPTLVAVLMFVTVVVAAAGLALANAARAVGGGAEGRWSVQLVGGRAGGPALAAALREAPGVRSAEEVPDAQLRALLRDWLGPEADSADLPLPTLIDVELAPGADPAPLRQRVAALAPTARLNAYRDQLGPLLGSLHTLQWLALALVLLMVLATAAAVMLATRGAYDTHRQTISVLHGVGATDEQLAGLFQRRMAREALAGATLGTVAGLGAVLLVLAGVGSDYGVIAGGPALRPRDLVALGLLPLAAALLALLVARATVLRALRAVP